MQTVFSSSSHPAQTNSGSRVAVGWHNNPHSAALFYPTNTPSPPSTICHVSLQHIPMQRRQPLASHLTIGRLHLWPVCPGSSRGLSAINCWLFRRGRLSAHLLPSSAPLPVIIEADTVPPWLPTYSASTQLPPPSLVPHNPLPSSSSSSCRCIFLCVSYHSPQTFSLGQAKRKHQTSHCLLKPQPNCKFTSFLKVDKSLMGFIQQYL